MAFEGTDQGRVPVEKEKSMWWKWKVRKSAKEFPKETLLDDRWRLEEVFKGHAKREIKVYVKTLQTKVEI